MGRSTEQSYRVIVDYLKQRSTPSTINDMIDANIASRATLYKLLRPEMFGTAALWGVKPLNNTKPFFFMYDKELQLQMLTQVDANAGEQLREQREVMSKAANVVSANAVILDDLEQSVIKALRKFRDAYDKDDLLRGNFAKDAVPVEFWLELFPQLTETFLAEPIKFQSFLIGAFVLQSKGLE